MAGCGFLILVIVFLFERSDGVDLGPPTLLAVRQKSWRLAARNVGGAWRAWRGPWCTEKGCRQDAVMPATIRKHEEKQEGCFIFAPDSDHCPSVYSAGRLPKLTAHPCMNFDWNVVHGLWEKSPFFIIAVRGEGGATWAGMGLALERFRTDRQPGITSHCPGH